MFWKARRKLLNFLFGLESVWNLYYYWGIFKNAQNDDDYTPAYVFIVLLIVSNLLLSTFNIIS